MPSTERRSYHEGWSDVLEDAGPVLVEEGVCLIKGAQIDKINRRLKLA
jgi:hypothetical protein